MSMKMNVNGVERDATAIEFVVVVVLSGVMAVGFLFAALLLLVIRLAAFVVPLALFLVIAFHVAKCYEDAVIGHRPAVVAKGGVDR